MAKSFLKVRLLRMLTFAALLAISSLSHAAGDLRASFEDMQKALPAFGAVLTKVHNSPQGSWH